MDVIYKSGCYGVLSCSVKMRPQKLMTWMRSDLGKGDWWSVGYSPAKANLITIRTKKKVYLNILTNYATLAQVGVQKRKRKYPCGTYQVNAPFVQKNYNQHKCAVDKWNKALLEYYRLARFVNDDVMYTQFFFHAFTIQSWTLYKTTTATDLSQLEFRKRLLQQLHDTLEPDLPKQLLAREVVHWPISRAPYKSRCQYLSCNACCSTFCTGCQKWGCSSCLRNFHLKE